MKPTIPAILLGLGLYSPVSAVLPVTDVASIVQNRVAHAATLAQWVESINNLRTQINQLNQQISIQDDLRRWSGNPAEVGANVVLDVLGEADLVREYGRTKDAIIGMTESLESLKRTAGGSYRAIESFDLNGNELRRDPLSYRRYSVLDAKQENTALVALRTQEREREVQLEIALTLEELKGSETDAEVHKLSAKLDSLNAQLVHVDAVRRREVDEVALQKIANDARLEQERQAASEMEKRDAHLSNQRVTDYMKTLKLRRTKP
jgi:hypothetical protein